MPNYKINPCNNLLFFLIRRDKPYLGNKLPPALKACLAFARQAFFGAWEYLQGTGR